MYKNKTLLFIYCILYIAFTSCSGTKSIAQNFNQTPSLLSDSIFTNAHVGICIYEPATNTYLVNYQGNKYFLPSSNVKIATCYAAMKYLGDSVLGLMYNIEKDSSITIFGTADPTFLHKDFINQPIFQQLKKYKHITLQNDNRSYSFFKQFGLGWALDDYEESYMPERNQFPIYGNVVNFKIENGTVNTQPNYYKKNTINNLSKVNNQNVFSVKRNIGANNFLIYSGKKNKLSITTPFVTSVANTQYLLADTLKIDVTEKTNELLNEELITYNKLYSQPTDSLLKPMMYNSDNFFAEQTLLMVSLNQLGFMSDEQIIDTLLKRDFNDLPQKPRWVDGSGLSRYNLFTPQDFVFILNKMKTNFNWQRIATIFPTANTGTLKGYYKNYEKKIYAKTGSMSNNYSLSGFIKTNAGKEVIFSIMINNYNNSNSMAVKLSLEKYITQIIENN